jgi:hypothetical protein
LFLTFMALCNSRKCPMRDRTIRLAKPRPECLNQVTSPANDSLWSCCSALLNARQTAISITAWGCSCVYLVAAMRPALSGV